MKRAFLFHYQFAYFFKIYKPGLCLNTHTRIIEKLIRVLLCPLPSRKDENPSSIGITLSSLACRVRFASFSATESEEKAGLGERRLLGRRHSGDHGSI